MAPTTGSSQAFRLVVLAPASQQGASLIAGDGDVLVGRQDSVDLRLDDPHVSRIHARLRRDGDRVLLDDLDSSGGTRVNGVPVRSGHELHHGDTISFATVDTRFERAPTADDDRTVTADLPVEPVGAPAPSSYQIGKQRAEVLNNVGRDQYNEYNQFVQERRTAFLEELATLKSNARRVLVFGFVLYVVGGCVYGFILLRFIASVSDTVADGSTDEPGPALFGSKVAGVPIGLLGFAAAAVGTICIVVGAVMHVVAAAKRRRFEQQLPTAWTQVSPPGAPSRSTDPSSVVSPAPRSFEPPPPPPPPPPPAPRSAGP